MMRNRRFQGRFADVRPFRSFELSPLDIAQTFGVLELNHAMDWDLPKGGQKRLFRGVFTRFP